MARTLSQALVKPGLTFLLALLCFVVPVHSPAPFDPLEATRSVFGWGAIGYGLAVDVALVAWLWVRSGRLPNRYKHSGSWPSALKWFLPRTVREPFTNDLLVDRERMLAEGRSRFFVTAASVFQVLVLITGVLKDVLIELAVGFLRPRGS